MHTVLIAGLVGLAPLVQHYLLDSSDSTPILPAFLAPKAMGGELDPPGPPSVAYIMARLVGRTPGDVIVRHWLEVEAVKPARNYRRVGRAREWQLMYRCDVVGPDGPITLYTDRDCLVRWP